MKYLLMLLIIVISVPFAVTAQEMSSPEYVLKLEQIEASGEAQLRSIRPETLLKLREDGYFIASVNEHPITFTISDTLVEIDDESEKKVYMSVRSEGKFGYQLTAFPWTPLQSLSGEQIPPTRCDQKKKPCTAWVASSWSNESNPGWGYHLSGPDISNGFSEKTSFRPFPLQERVPLASREHTIGERASQISFKVLKDPADTTTYTSLIQFLAIPTL